MSASTDSFPEKPKRDEPNLDEVILESRARAMRLGRLYTLPYWLFFLILIGIFLAFAIATNEIYANIFSQLQEGVGMTIFVSLLSYILALMIAIVVGIIRSNPPKPPETSESLSRTILRILKTVIYNLSTMYVSVMRGIPILVVLLVTAFILVPALNNTINAILTSLWLDIFKAESAPELVWRGSSAPSAILALGVTYGAYMSETIRAGIQSIDKGQIEAAYSVGMTYIQTLRYIVLPQAFRNVLPPLGNDFIAMIKDSSLLALLGVRDMTQVAKTSSGRSFRYVETYAILAYLYLTMVIIASTLVNALEDTINVNRETPRWVKRLSGMRTKRKRGVDISAYIK